MVATILRLQLPGPKPPRGAGGDATIAAVVSYGVASSGTWPGWSATRLSQVRTAG